MAKSPTNDLSNNPPLEQLVQNLSKAVVYLITDITATRKSLTNGLKKIDKNFEEIHKKIDALSNDTGENFVDVNMNLKSIKTEIAKIGKATQYEDALRNLELVQGGKKD